MTTFAVPEEHQHKVLTAVQLFRHRDEDPDVEDNVVIRTARRILPITDQYAGGKVLARVEGRRMVTPLRSC